MAADANPAKKAFFQDSRPRSRSAEHCAPLNTPRNRPKAAQLRPKERTEAGTTRDRPCRRAESPGSPGSPRSPAFEGKDKDDKKLLLLFGIAVFAEEADVAPPPPVAAAAAGRRLRCHDSGPTRPLLRPLFIPWLPSPPLRPLRMSSLAPCSAHRFMLGPKAALQAMPGDGV